MICAIAAGTSFTVDHFRERALDNSKRELENTVLLLTRHFDQQFRELGRIQKSLTAQLLSNGIVSPSSFASVMSSYESHVMLKSKLDDVIADDINILDANGNLISSSGVWPAPSVQLGDRSYFQKLKSLSYSHEEIVEHVFGRITGKWKTVFSRRISGPNGEFFGVINRAVDATDLEKFLGSVMLNKNYAIAMFHRDGTLLARYPQTPGAIGQKQSGPVIQHLRFSNEPATMQLVSPIDGVERIASVRLLGEFPIAIVATNAIESILADWRSQTRFLIGMAILSALIVAMLLFLVIRCIQRENVKSQMQLTLEKNRLDTAINNMTQGLLLFDSDTRVVVCNERYLNMYRLSRDVIKPGILFRDVIAYRKATGSLAGDPETYVTDVLRDIGRASVNIGQTADGRAIQISSRPVPGGGWVATHEDITERRNAEAKIEHLAHYDALTDLPNRTLFRVALERELGRVARGEQCAVLYIDIDEFKGINDSLGHPVGDELLKAISLRLRNCVRSSDIVARLGGDEFAIVQTDIRTHSDTTDLVERIYATIREPFECLGHRLLTDASIGIALAPRDGTNLDELLKNADLAMYGAKAEGRRTFRFFEPEMDAKVKSRRTLEFDLQQAAGDAGFIASGFEVYYQPLLSLRDDEVVGCEALLRWRHPQRGMISPADFIPVAEEIGIISQLGEWVLTTACMEAANWPGDIKIAVNVSPVQFRCASLSLKVAAALAASGLPARRLELEITEAVLIRDDETALDILHQLRALGIRIALDDFGTGYSSLSYLQRFPFDKIKIDRCFVTDITEAKGSSSIVQAVVNIATSQNMTTTAEGVETTAQKTLLRDLGCTEMQGYLFSPARPAADIRALLIGYQPTSDAHHRDKAGAAA